MNNKKVILVVDDDLHILEVIEARLSSAGFHVFTAVGARKALEILNDRHVDLLISDVRMPGMGGMDLLREVRVLKPELPIIFLTAHGTIPDAVHAIKEGANEYLTKPFKGKELLAKIDETLKKAFVSVTDRATSSLNHELYDGKSASMKALYDMIDRVISSDVNVLILGESGVGKDRVARIIHQKGPRRNSPFVVVDCGSTPTGLLESELFGHVQGAFTHATRDKKGLIEASDGGTLFLDEIGNISSEMQVRLLRFLEGRKIRKVGGLKEVSVDCRVISATNIDLPAEVEAGRFREDLYYRIRVVTLQIPPLRDRKEDIPLLAHEFVEEFCKNQGRPLIKLPPETIEWLCEYSWPGNVRELKNALEGAVVLCEDEVLHPGDLQQLTGFSKTPRKSLLESSSLSLEEGEKKLILKALEEAEWVQKDAAQLLEISRRVLHYKIKKFGINIPRR